MPYVSLLTNVAVPKEKEARLIEVLGKGIEVITDKTEENLFIKIEGDCALYKGGNTTVPNAMVSVDLFGYSTNEDLTKYCAIINEVLAAELGITKEKTFINFTECRHWGGGFGCNTAYEV